MDALRNMCANALFMSVEGTDVAMREAMHTSRYWYPIATADTPHDIQ